MWFMKGHRHTASRFFFNPSLQSPTFSPVGLRPRQAPRDGRVRPYRDDRQMNLQELKRKTPAELLAFAEELEIENASSLRKQDMLFAILKRLAENDVPISGDGVLEVLQDGFGFLRSPEANYLPGPDDIYVSPSQVRRFGLRTGDTVEGEIRSPKDGERYFALLKVNKINFDEPDKLRHRINFDNLTPLYPDEKLTMELEGKGDVELPKKEEEAPVIKVEPGKRMELGRSKLRGSRESSDVQKVDITARIIDL